MTLYAFDGTGNEDGEDDGKDSNVVRFKELYKGGSVEYLEGIGTRHGVIGKAIGGIFGAGGRSRITEMIDAVRENWEQGDKVIDVVGFSRGAALAVHFCNAIGEDGLILSDGSSVKPSIRFLGVWDIVGSFGLAVDTIIDFQDINLGWNIDTVADSVENCFHAMALDERRESFGLTRLDQNGNKDNITEVWFRGVHSDIGGGNRNTDRSNIALQWMVQQAEKCGVEIDQTKNQEAKYSRIDHSAKISQNKDPKRDPRRTIAPGDAVFELSKAKTLEIGESFQFIARSELLYNWSGVELVKGASYQIKVAPDQTWVDGDITCDAGGWKSEDLPWYKESIVQFFENKKRCPEANWFELVGAYGDESEDCFVIGLEKTITAEKTSDLYVFANDLRSKYSNNEGSISISIERAT